ncbi:hypothetical protein [Sulfurimonas sp. HSL-1716]|uniref:hypothetical protein n=1 Tax=Hydrocurvibacter sulfurireducens TaxID=3131937 RepID=UPI0031FA1974
MKIDNPFESGQIKNYLLFYAAIVVIMILFFIATTLFHDIKQEKTKVFDTNTTAKPAVKKTPKKKTSEKNPSIILMKKNVY